MTALLTFLCFGYTMRELPAPAEPASVPVSVAS